MADVKKRIEWVDIAKCICIIAVMFHHSDFTNDILVSIYEPFFLNAFFLCSGYTYNRRPFGQFIKRRVETLLVPWFIFGSILILMGAVQSFNERLGLKEEFMWFFLQIRGKNDRLWFLTTLFLTSILFYFLVELINKYNNSKKVYIISFLVLSCLKILSSLYSILMNPRFFPWERTSLPWHLELLMPYLLMMLIGYALRQHYEENFDSFMNVKNTVITIIVYMVIIVLSKLYISGSLEAISIYISNVIGTMIIISICKKIKINRVIEFIGQNSIIYYCFHGKLLSLIQVVLKKVIGQQYGVILNNPILSTIVGLIIVIIISVILVLPVLIVNKYLPFTVGKKRK